MSATTLDPRGVRLAATISSVILAVGLITTSWRVMAAQAALFALCTFGGMRFNPWRQLFRFAVLPMLREPAMVHREAPEPVRFAQGVGFGFAMVATIGYAAGWTALGFAANAFALVAASLNAVFGFCLGCRLYPLLRPFSVPGRSTSDAR